MPIDSIELKDFQPPRVKRAGLPGPSPRTVGRLRTVTDDTPVSLVRDMGTYWEIIAGGSGQPFINVKDAAYGAVGDGATDDTAAINAAIAAANAISTSTTAYGATVLFPPGLYLISATLTAPTQNVRLLGAGGAVWNATNVAASVIKASFKGTPILSLGSSGNHDITIEGLGFKGAGASGSAAGLTSYAIYGASITTLWILNCNFDNFGGSAIRIDAGSGCNVYDTQNTNCLLDYAYLSGQAGVVQLACTEVELDRCNFNGNILTSTHSAYGSGYLAAIYCTGAPIRAVQTVAAFAQVGWYLAGGSAPSSLYDCRGEFNQGEGFIITGNEHNLTDCCAFGNSMATDDTYFGFYFKDNAINSRNCLTSCRIDSLGSGVFASYRMKGFLKDDVGQGDAIWRTNKVFNPIIGANTLAETNGAIIKTSNTPLMLSPVPYKQAKTGTGTQTFDGTLGDVFYLTVNANTTTTVAATRLIQGHTYKLVVLNSSGATPAIGLDTNFKIYGYVAPANGKYRYVDMVYDGTNLIGNSSGDI